MKFLMLSTTSYVVSTRKVAATDFFHLEKKIVVHHMCAQPWCDEKTFHFPILVLASLLAKKLSHVRQRVHLDLVMWLLLCRAAGIFDLFLMTAVL